MLVINLRDEQETFTVWITVREVLNYQDLHQKWTAPYYLLDHCIVSTLWQIQDPDWRRVDLQSTACMRSDRLHSSLNDLHRILAEGFGCHSTTTVTEVCWCFAVASVIAAGSQVLHSYTSRKCVVAKWETGSAPCLHTACCRFIITWPDTTSSFLTSNLKQKSKDVGTIIAKHPHTQSLTLLLKRMRVAQNAWWVLINTGHQIQVGSLRKINSPHVN